MLVPAGQPQIGALTYQEATATVRNSTGGTKSRLIALSIRQPWAWAIVNGHKDVENRLWATDHRGSLLIHAGKKFDRRGFGLLEQLGIAYPDEPDVGGIVGMVDVIGCIDDSESPWAREGSWHWLLARPLEFRSPIPCQGRLGLFVPTISGRQLGAAKRYAKRHRRRRARSV